MRGPLGEILDQGGDGGDSCNFTCAYAFFTGTWPNPRLYFGTPKEPVRHPVQVPWNNPKNFGRDQATPLVAVYQKRAAREFFKYHWLFLPSTERDKPGSKKMLRPHCFYKDSNPDTTTKPMQFDWKELKWKITLPLWKEWNKNPQWKIETRLIDGPDINTPDTWGMMVMKGKIWILYPFLPICFLWCFFSVIGHCYQARNPEYNDFKQLFIVSTFYKLEKFFAWLHPHGLVKASYKYFIQRRNLPELHEAFVGYLERKGI